MRSTSRLIGAIYRKELLETLRDRKTLFMTYGMPLIVYPLLTLWGGEAATIRMEKEKKETYQVAIVGEARPELLSQIQRMPRTRLLTLEPAIQSRLESDLAELRAGHESQVSSDLRSTLESQKLTAVLTPRAQGENLRLGILFDDSDPASARGADAIGEQLETWASELRKQRLRSRGLAEDFAEPLQVNRFGLAGPKRMIGKALGTGAPFLILVFLCISAYYPALNTTVGERERGTLTTLLSTPVTASQLILGKFLSVLTSSITGVATYLLSLLGCAWLLAHQMPKLGLAGGVLELVSTSAMLVAVVVATGALVSAASLCLGLAARKISEGQALLTLLILLVSFPAAIALTADLPLAHWTSAIPLLNFALIIKTVAIGSAPLGLGLIAFAVNAAAARGLLAFAAQILRAEFVGGGGGAALLGWSLASGSAPIATQMPQATREPALGAPGTMGTLDTMTSLLLLGIAAGGSFYLSVALGDAPLVLQILATQLGVLIALPTLILRLQGISLWSVLPRRLPHARAWGAALLAGTGAAILSARASAWLPIPEELSKEVARRIGGSAGTLPLPVLVLMTGILPAICEETLFRGLILPGFLRRFSGPWAVALTALGFGLVHLSLLRFVPTAAIGLLLGFTMLRSRSLWPCIVLHATYNSTLVLLSRASSPWDTPVHLVVAALFVILGAAILDSQKRLS